MASGSAPETTGDPVAAAIEVLAAPAAPAPALASASRALAASQEPRAVRALSDALSLPHDSPAFRAALDAIAGASSADASLLAKLSELFAVSTAGEKPFLFQAISSIRTRAAAQFLVSVLVAPGTQPAERALIASALARLSGRDDLGEKAESWRAYVDAVSDEAAWRDRLLADLARGADRANERQFVTQARLLQALQALHLATPPEKRWALIGSMLQDQLEPVNLLGLELVSRELSAGNRPDDAISVAALALLKSANPAIREQAAILAGNLAPAGAAAALLAALETESSPKTAGAMLLALSRWPSFEGEAAVLHWLDASPGSIADARAARDAAIDAAWTFYRAGYLRQNGAASRTLRALRAISLADLPGSGCRLRAELGDQSDLDAVVVLLGSSIPAQRLAAAESLVAYPEYLPRILAAAREDPLLIEVAVRGVLTVDPGVPGFLAIEEATRRVPDQRRAALTLIASVLNEDEIVECSRRLSADPPLREAVLAQLAESQRIMSERTDPAHLPTVASAILELAQLRFELSRYGEAIAALDALPEIDKLTPTDSARDLRALSLIGMNRPEQARQLGIGPEVWLRALEVFLAQPQAAQIASAIETGMGDRLSADERRRFEQLKSKIGTRK